MYYKSFHRALFLCTQEDDVLVYCNTSTELRPAYVVFIDHKHKEVVVGIRGTDSLSDLVTDILAVTE